MELFEAIREADWLRVRALTDAGADVNARAGDGSTPLMAAAGLGHAPMVNILLAAGADVNATAGDSDSAMFRAAGSRRQLVFLTVQRLTEPGLRELTQARLGRDPKRDWSRHDDRIPRLATAAGEGRAEEVRRLLDAGVDIDAFDRRSGAEAIKIAAAAGNATGVRTLLDAGADPEVISLSTTALMEAARSGSAESVRLLLAAGADPTLPSFRGNITPLMVAVQRGHRDVAEVLLRWGADAHARYATAMLAQIGPAESFPTEPRARLLWAAQRGRVDDVRAALDRGVSASSRNPRGFSALELAARGGHPAAVDALLAAGAGAVRHTLNLALVEAAGGGHVPVARSLIRAGAEVDCQLGDWRMTPLCRAIEGGHPEMVSALIREFGADLHAPALHSQGSSLEAPGSGTSPLVHATMKADPRIVRILRDAGATKRFGGRPLEGLRGLQHPGESRPWLAVRAPIEEAARSFVAARGVSTWTRDVYGREVAITDRCFLAIQLRGHPWTLICDRSCRERRDSISAEDARAVSGDLGGLALFFEMVAVRRGRLRLYDSGRPEEDLDGVPAEAASDVLEEQEVFLPRFLELELARWREGPGRRATVGFHGLDAEDFERVDFVSLPTDPADDDPDEDEDPEERATTPTYDPSLTPDDVASIAEALGRPSDILSIRRQDRSRFRVMTGFIAGPLCGMGHTYIVERAGDGWCVTDAGGWVS